MKCINDFEGYYTAMSLSFEARMETKHNDLVDEVRSDVGLLHVSMTPDSLSFYQRYIKDTCFWHYANYTGIIV